MFRLMGLLLIIAPTGAAFIGRVRGETIVSDAKLKDAAAASPGLHYASVAAGTASVIGLETTLQKRPTA